MNFLSEALKRVSAVGSIGANHPTLFFAAGVTGMVTSTVLACRATLKLEATLDDHIDDNVVVNGVINDSVTKIHQPLGAALAVARLYAPAAIVGVASITMLTKSHNTLVKRNAALSAAYTALDKGFRDYRARVVTKYGQEADDELRYGGVVEKEKVGGKTVSKTKAGPTAASIYAVWFDEYNPNWGKDPEINKLFLRAQQNYLNDLLHARGHVFLNEAYTALGFDHTQAGSVVGWILNEGGDNYIDLGVFNGEDDDRIRDFVNGREATILLDFNVDGLIWDKIKKHPAHDVTWQRSRWLRV